MDEVKRLYRIQRFGSEAIIKAMTQTEALRYRRRGYSVQAYSIPTATPSKGQESQDVGSKT